MSDKNIKDSSLFSVDQLESVIKKSLQTALKPVQKTFNDLKEAYVAEPKHFSLVTDFTSQKTKDAHTQLYQNYIESLNRISAELDSIDKTEINANHSVYRSTKLDETRNMNAVWLHELFFANCFDPHSEIYMDSKCYLRLEREWGTFDAWQKDFMACALSAGNGWAVCSYSFFLKKFTNTIITDHSQDVQVGLYPVIVLDTWEHSYNRDYLNDKKSYMLAMMKQMNWEVINERFDRIEKIERAAR